MDIDLQSDPLGGNQMKLTATQIRYLLSIYQLSKSGMVRSSDIADNLDVSRPSAHRMVDQLLKMNLIVKDKYSLIRLDDNSRNMADQYREGFSHISGFLQEYLNLTSDAAEDGALSILSGLNLSALKELCIRIDENVL